MKKNLFVMLLCAIFATSASAQSTICIPFGSSVNIDGVVTATEWQDADSVYVGSGSQTKVFYKHDSLNFLVAFVGYLQSSSRIPEILIDVDNDKNATWETDDWWFHVSAQDCEYLGEYGNYDSCGIVRSNWTAVENMAAGPAAPPYNDTIEVEIPFSTIGISLTDTIGISFLVTNLFSSWSHWPTEANRNNPSTWGTGVFCSSSASINDVDQKNRYNVSPNPANDYIYISSFDIGLNEMSIAVFDQTGKEVYEETLQNGINNIYGFSTNELSEGIYFLQIKTSQLQVTEKIIIVH